MYTACDLFYLSPNTESSKTSSRLGGGVAVDPTSTRSVWGDFRHGHYLGYFPFYLARDELSPVTNHREPFSLVLDNGCLIVDLFPRQNVRVSFAQSEPRREGCAWDTRLPVTAVTSYHRAVLYLTLLVNCKREYFRLNKLTLFQDHNLPHAPGWDQGDDDSTTFSVCELWNKIASVYAEGLLPERLWSC